MTATSEPGVAEPRRTPLGLQPGQVWTLVVAVAIAIVLTLGGLVPVLRGERAGDDVPEGNAPVELEEGPGEGFQPP